MQAADLSHRHRQSVIFIVITVLIDAIGYGIVIPVVPKLIMELTNASLSTAAYFGGGLWLSYAISQFIGAPIVGNLSDRFGRRPVLLCALFALGIDYLLMGIAPTIAWLFVGRFIAGIAGSTYSTANAYTADISTADNRAQNFGMLGAAFGGGFILGPVIGGLLGELGPRVPFFAAAGLSLLNVAYGFFVLRESLHPDNRRRFDWRKANPVGSLGLLRANPIILYLAIALFLYMFGHFSLPSVWTFFVIEKFQWNETAVGFSLGFAGVLMVLVQAGLIRIIIPRIGATNAGCMGMVLMSTGFLGYAFATQGWHLYGWLSVAALAGLVMPALQTAMTSRIGANHQGELQGAIASLSSITTVFAPLIMTQLFGFFTSASAPIYFPGAPFVLSASLTASALLLFFVTQKKAVALAAV